MREQAIDPNRANLAQHGAAVLCSLVGAALCILSITCGDKLVTNRVVDESDGDQQEDREDVGGPQTQPYFQPCRDNIAEQGLDRAKRADEDEDQDGRVDGFMRDLSAMLGCEGYLSSRILTGRRVVVNGRMELTEM